MSLDRPRRIFRSSRPARFAVPMPRTLALVLAGLGISVAVLQAAPLQIADWAQSSPGSLAAAPQEVAVIDGATLRLADRLVRLAGVDAPARGQQCRHPGGARVDCAAGAAAVLSRLVREHAVTCRLAGQDDGGMAEGFCEAAGSDLNRAVILAGFARAESDAPGLRAAEKTARAQRRGLWGDGASF